MKRSNIIIYGQKLSPCPRISGHDHSVWVIDACRNSGLSLEQHDSVLLCALQWNILSIVVTPRTAENVLISEVPSF